VGQTIVIGTILHHDSLLAYLLSRDDVYTTHIYRAIQADDTVLWPERYSRATLDQVRLEIGSLAFAQEYLNTPLDPASQVFKPAWWRWYTSADIAYDDTTDYWRFRGEPLEIYAACDPALAGQDEFVTQVIGISPARAIVVLDPWQGSLDFPDQIAHLKRLAADWLPRTLGIEGNAYQTALIQHLQREVLVPIRRIVQTGAKGNKQARIVALAPYVEAGQVYLRAATDTEPGTIVPEIGVKVHAKHYPLFEQATQYPASSHDDRIDALEMAISTARVRKFFDAEGKAL
jgi:predicted phage terminase large subunit-like protein